MDECPNCHESLVGGLIYDTMLHDVYDGDEDAALQAASHYGATKTEGRWGLALGMYSLDEDRTVAYRCPFCGHEWPR